MQTATATSRAKAIADQELEVYGRRTTASRAAIEKASARLPLGVPSSFQAYDPHPIVVQRSSGVQMVDVDGNEYVDFNMGYGALMVGHAHPHLVSALERQLHNGSLYVTPSPGVHEAAELICDRFPVEAVRFTNSGTEATMDAIRVARAFTGRDRIIKAEGCYHGHHDEVLMSVKPDVAAAGPADAPSTVPFSEGIPRSVAEHVSVVPFNDVKALRATLAAHDDVAAVILEPVAQNMGIVLPGPDYLRQVRALCDEFGVLLILDEVKTGITAGRGGASGHFGVTPDLLCLAKSIGGGVPVGAFGGRADVMAEITEGRAMHLGTYNGNPLVMAAVRAVLEDIVTTEAFERSTALNERLVTGCDEVIARTGLPAHTVTFGAKGCVTYREKPVRNYRHYKDTNFELAFAHWIWMVNRGVLLPPGLDEQWLVSVQHDESHVDRHLEVFATFAESVTS